MAKTPIEIMLDNVEWKETGQTEHESDLPYATHRGIVNIGGMELEAFILNDGSRVFSEESVKRFFGML